jgi:hypothetical protein
VAPRSLPDTDIARVRRWVDARNEGLPDRAVGLIRYEMDVHAGAVTLLECRPPWQGHAGSPWTRFPIVRLRYTKSRREWALFWRDRNLKFHLYDLVEPTRNVETLLDEVDRDPTCIFWG